MECSVFPLPSVEKCKENLNRLKKTWGKPSDFSLYYEAQQFFSRCLTFHHLIFSKPEGLKDILKSKNILSYQNAEAYYQCSRTREADRKLGLHKYVFLSFGIPINKTGPCAIILGFPFKSLLKNFKYPKAWASWGDIMTYAEDISKCEIPSCIDYNNPVFKDKVIKEYTDHIFTLDDLPEIAACFSLKFFNPYYYMALAHKWKTNTGQFYCRGPEIKIADALPLSLATHCFVNDKSKELVKQIKAMNVLSPECVIAVDSYFGSINSRLNFVKELYLTP